MKNTLYSLIAVALISWSCNQASTEQQSMEENNESIEEAMASKLEYEDSHSYSKPSDAIVNHLKWKANVDFDAKIIKAIATYTIENKSGTDSILLDTRNLTISSVTRDDAEGEVAYSLHAADKIIGSKLAIPITSNTTSISIEYTTTAGADALQFLDPIQTADKKYNFLFTQSQAILARTWLPCQDSPGIRFTYEAEVTVPEGMMAVMSASNPTEINESGVYTFQMEQPVPSYLMALAVGKLQYKSLGSEAGVYAESSVIEAAAYEFADMQNMIDTAESLYGPYQWGKYDVIVLPPSFPFGGMENPRLTFATPTIIAGDRSLTALIAHELAHSWSGNLVTNATWEDIWLNEGFTVYFENRIMEEIFGKDFANMLALLSYDGLLEEIEYMNNNDRAADTRLRVDLVGRNPDDGLTSIPYDKGFFFLKLLEETVGRENWDAFLSNYFDKFQFKVMTSEAFLYYLDHELLSKDSSWAAAVQAEKWVYGEGLPDNCPIIHSSQFEKVESQVYNWQEGTAPSDLVTADWMTPQWLHFLHQLPDEMSVDQMNGLDAAFGFTASGNSEIQAAWFVKVIPNNYQVAFQPTEDFLIEVGRRKFLTPIYKAILNSEAGADRAMDIYKKARPNYHAVSKETLDNLLSYGEDS